MQSALLYTVRETPALEIDNSLQVCSEAKGISALRCSLFSVQEGSFTEMYSKCVSGGLVNVLHWKY